MRTEYTRGRTRYDRRDGGEYNQPFVGLTEDEGVPYKSNRGLYSPHQTNPWSNEMKVGYPRDEGLHTYDYAGWRVPRGINLPENQVTHR